MAKAITAVCLETMTFAHPTDLVPLAACPSPASSAPASKMNPQTALHSAPESLAPVQAEAAELGSTNPSEPLQKPGDRKAGTKPSEVDSSTSQASAQEETEEEAWARSLDELEAMEEYAGSLHKHPAAASTRKYFDYTCAMHNSRPQFANHALIV